MIASPLVTATLFHIGPIGISAPVITTWVIMALLVTGAGCYTRRLSLTPSKMQTLLELLVGTIDDQIRDTMQADPGRYRALVGTRWP
jgi:F-type H+-transporting ATPase subunit a